MTRSEPSRRRRVEAAATPAANSTLSVSVEGAEVARRSRICRPAIGQPDDVGILPIPAAQLVASATADETIVARTPVEDVVEGAPGQRVVAIARGDAAAADVTVMLSLSALPPTVNVAPPAARSVAPAGGGAGADVGGGQCRAVGEPVLRDCARETIRDRDLAIQCKARDDEMLVVAERIGAGTERQVVAEDAFAELDDVQSRCRRRW